MIPYISYREIERIKSKKEQRGSNIQFAGNGKKASHACGSDSISLIWNSDRGLSRKRSNDTKIHDKKVTILVIDDDPDTRLLYCEILEDFGYRALAESDALSALAAIENTSEVKLVITDYRMPGMSGLEFADILPKLRPGVPVILLTACVSIENYLMSRDLGVFEFVDKSVKKGELVRIVQSALEAQNP
jgi:CheY-like chemotaxis protein